MRQELQDSAEKRACMSPNSTGNTDTALLAYSNCA